MDNQNSLLISILFSGGLCGIFEQPTHIQSQEHILKQISLNLVLQVICKSESL